MCHGSRSEKAALSSKKNHISFHENLSRTKAVLIAKNSPVHACLIRKDIFSEGIGTAVVSRKMPDGRLGAGVYLLDVFA